MYNNHGEKIVAVTVLQHLLAHLPEGAFVRCNVSNDLAIHDGANGEYLGYYHVGNQTMHWVSDE